MKIELEKYRQMHISYEELCVAAAFLKIPCLYGVPDRWMKSGQDNLYNRVMRISAGMEAKGSLLTDISGTVRMETQLYKFVNCMGNAHILGRINYESEDGVGKVYLYGKDTELVFLEPDGKCGCYLGILGSEEIFSNLLKEIPKKKPDAEMAFGLLTETWMGALIFERRDTLYETVYDLAWTVSSDENLEVCWKKISSLFGVVLKKEEVEE